MLAYVPGLRPEGAISIQVHDGEVDKAVACIASAFLPVTGPKSKQTIPQRLSTKQRTTHRTVHERLSVDYGIGRNCPYLRHRVQRCELGTRNHSLRTCCASKEYPAAVSVQRESLGKRERNKERERQGAHRAVVNLLSVVSV